MKRPSTSLLREFATNIWTNKKDWTEVDLRWEQRPLWWYSILGSVLWKQSLKELKWYVTNCYSTRRASEHASWFHDSCRKQHERSPIKTCRHVKVNGGRLPSEKNVWIIFFLFSLRGSLCSPMSLCRQLCIASGTGAHLPLWSSYLRRWKEKQPFYGCHQVSPGITTLAYKMNS